MSRAAQMTAIVAAFLLALVLAPLALALGLAWLVWRVGVYATARVGTGEIIGWSGEGQAAAIETAQAFPRLSYQAHDGALRVFTSRMAFNVYDDPPPTGGLPIRYHLSPRPYAEIDDKAHWFTGPVLTIAAALLGIFVTAVWRPIAAFWFGG
jgi:hypothetical protein